MRELKFRVWDNKNKKFLPESHFAILGSGKVIVTLSGYYEHFTNKTQDDYVVQQYTGFKDKNGNSIHEGDIVKYKTWTGSHDGTTEEHRTQVQFKDGAYYPRYINDECDDSWYSFKVYDLEVVGNVFETPHLDEHN